jgi:hypothetical protein
MIPVSAPLDFPKVVPADWDIWNNVWDKNFVFVPKVTRTPNIGQAPWVGFDIYVKPGVDATDTTKYKCKNLNCPELFPSLFDNLHKLPIDVQVVRVLKSLRSVPAHSDFSIERHSIRSMLFDNNPTQTWWYQNDDKNKHYLKLPEETNTWWYDDSKLKHGTDFYRGHFKQLIIYVGPTKTELLNESITHSISKYPDHIMYV